MLFLCVYKRNFGNEIIITILNFQHPRIPRGDSARYINIDVAGGIIPGYPRMLKQLNTQHLNSWKWYSYLRGSGTGVVPGQHNNLTAIFR